MSPLVRLAPLIALLAQLFVGRPADAQPTRQQIMDVLKQKIELKLDGEVTFKTLTEMLMRDAKFADGKSLSIIFNHQAFLVDDDIPPDPEETLVKLPRSSRKLPVGVVLRLALSQVPTGNATFLIRDGQIEITTHKAASPEELLGYPITARFDKTPLRDAIEELCEISGATILIDSRVGEKARAPVSAVFTNTIALEGAVRLLAEMADLEADVRENVLFITGQPKPADEGKKADLKLKERRLDRALCDLAHWSRANIVLDSRLAPGPTPLVHPSRFPQIFGGIKPPERWQPVFKAETSLDPDLTLVSTPRLRIPPPPGVGTSGWGHGILDLLNAPNANVKVTATFKHGVSAQGAARILANQARLSTVVLDGVIYVTDAANAKRLRKEARAK